MINNVILSSRYAYMNTHIGEMWPTSQYKTHKDIHDCSNCSQQEAVAIRRALYLCTTIYILSCIYTTFLYVFSMYISYIRVEGMSHFPSVATKKRLFQKWIHYNGAVKKLVLPSHTKHEIQYAWFVNRFTIGGPKFKLKGQVFVCSDNGNERNC